MLNIKTNENTNDVSVELEGHPQKILNETVMVVSTLLQQLSISISNENIDYQTLRDNFITNLLNVDIEKDFEIEVNKCECELV